MCTDRLGLPAIQQCKYTAFGTIIETTTTVQRLKLHIKQYICFIRLIQVYYVTCKKFDLISHFVMHHISDCCLFFVLSSQPNRASITLVFAEPQTGHRVRLTSQDLHAHRCWHGRISIQAPRKQQMLQVRVGFVFSASAAP